MSNASAHNFGLHKSLGLSGETLRQISALNATASMVKALAPPPGIAELMRQMETRRGLVDSISGSFASRLGAVATDFLRSQDAVTKAMAGMFGPGTAVHELARAAKLATERYDAMFGPASNLAKSWTLAQSHFDGMNKILRDIHENTAPIAKALSELQPLALRINRDLFDTPAMRATQAMIRSLSGSTRPVGFDSTTLSAMHRLDLSGLGALSERMRILTAMLPATAEDRGDEEEPELTNAELQEVRETGDAVASVIEDRFDSLDARIEQTNVAIRRIESMMQKRWRNVIVLFLLSSIWNLLLNVAASYIYEYLKATSQAVQSIPAQSTRPADVMRQARRSAYAIGVPPEVIRTFRVVKRHSLPVFDDDGESAGPTARLRLGTVVEIRGSAGKWRYVRWSSDDQSETTEGWVRAKYLGKLKP